MMSSQVLVLRALGRNDISYAETCLLQRWMDEGRLRGRGSDYAPARLVVF